LEEETHMTISWILTPLSTVSWIWFPEWANNDKRKQRYAEFQWERVHIFTGSAIKLTTTCFQNEDTWKTSEWIAPEICLEKLIQYAKNDHPNTYAYRIAQQSAIRAACIAVWCPISFPTIDIR
jgi:hypothetical protein